MAGFEPATTCTPSRCATRLRYIPRRRSRLLIIPLQESQNVAQLLADLLDRDLRALVHRRRRDLEQLRGRRGLALRRGRLRGELRLETLLRAGDREALVVEQLLDAQDRLDVASPIDALAGAVLRGSERGELGLPVAQHVRL